ncbi:MAG: hypothetical protein ABSA70_09265, partial [Terriglobia bacterium]
MGRKKSPEAGGRLVDVAVLAAIRNPLTYRVPESMEVRPGQRVLVPLATRRATGVALEPVARVALGFKVREILRVLDPEPLLSPELLTLGLWIAEYYLAPVGEVFRAMLPLRAQTRRARLLLLAEAGRRKLDELDSSLLGEVRASEEASLLRYLAGHEAGNQGMPFENVRRKFNQMLVSHARAEGWITVSEVERERGQRKVLAVRLTAPPAHQMVHGPLPERAPRLSPVARRILEALNRQGPVDDHRELLKATRANLTHLKKFSQQGWLELSESKGFEDVTTQEQEMWPELTPAQTGVLDELTKLLETRQFHPVLLHGITASGKTEIYLR